MDKEIQLKTYIVGGAVRDELLGLPVKDKDYVVVGTTPQAMLDAGYKPVGKDFPVFLQVNRAAHRVPRRLLCRF